jgi:cytochrome c-type biogenesis protein CcmH
VRRRRLTAAVAAALALALPIPAAACPRTTVGDLEDEVMCPVCGTSLATAGDEPLAVQQRRVIDRLARQCKSKDEIKDALVAQYGESVLADPESEGFGVTTWLVPGLGIAAGLAIAALAALRWRRGRAPRPLPAGTGPAAPDVRRLDEDMRRYDL